MGTMTNDLLSNIGTEVCALVDQKLDEFRINGATSGVDTSEMCLSKLNDNADYLKEVVEAVDGNVTQLAKIDTLESGIADIKKTIGVLPLIRTQLSSITALLSEALKVSPIYCIFGLFEASTPSV